MLNFCKRQLKAFGKFLRIYRNLPVFLFVWAIFGQLEASPIPLVEGDYRSIASGDYDNPGIWERWNGAQWLPALQKPGQGNSIFIDQGHEIRLRMDESAMHVYLFSAANPGRKLNLQQFGLQVFGSLRALTKVGGEFHLNSVSSALTDWIYPETGKIVFRGFSRTVVDRASWSANTTNSRYTVVFAPFMGETLTVNAAFKASSFVIQSGTVLQTVNTAGIPVCSTFSFNNQTIFNGNGPYGDFVIEAGATLQSNCSALFAQIIRRSETVPAARFHLKPGGNLRLTGADPTLDAAQVLLEGNVFYGAQTGMQTMLRRIMPLSAELDTYANLYFEGEATKRFRERINLQGHLGLLSGMAPLDGPTHLLMTGTGLQRVFGFSLQVSDLTVDKPAGRLALENDLRIGRNFTMLGGQMDFLGNELFFPVSGTGLYSYSGGSWLNLHRMHYLSLPLVLLAENATFPFEDLYQGGIRKVQLLGNSPGGSLMVRFMEIPGVNWDPNFDDVDGTPILYQLNSYFLMEVSGNSSASIELRISADQLVVDQVDDLRIVGNGEAAPPGHLPGLDPGLWARRSLPFSSLHRQEFTVGSFRKLSFLPVVWKTFNAAWENGWTTLEWSTYREYENDRFILWRSFGGVDNFQPIAEISAGTDPETVQEYAYRYKQAFPNMQTYYRIQQVDRDGKNSWSKVIRLELSGEIEPQERLKIYPNPYRSGRLTLQLPKGIEKDQAEIILVSASGMTYFSGRLLEFVDKLALEELPPGIYFLQVSHGKRNFTQTLWKQ